MPTKKKAAPAVATRATKKKAAPAIATRDTTKKKAAPKAKPPQPVKRVSAIAAAYMILSEAQVPLGAKELIERMATAGLWTSPGGKTPDATLYAAIVREINAKGDESRFAKSDEKGKFIAAR